MGESEFVETGGYDEGGLLSFPRTGCALMRSADLSTKAFCFLPGFNWWRW